jgi:uncharacterized protein (DUF169 family)
VVEGDFSGIQSICADAMAVLLKEKDPTLLSDAVDLENLLE